MLTFNDPVVNFKLSFLHRVLPSGHVVVYGDMYRVEGGYTEFCAENGADRVTLVDTLETPGWQRTRLRHSNIDFYKGSFADAGFMASLPGTFDAGVLYDILLHQPPLLHALHLMLAPVDRGVVIVQPILEELEEPNALVFLPGNENHRLYPLSAESPEYMAFSTEEVNQSRWIWGMTSTFLHSVLMTEGFEVVHEEKLSSLPNPKWAWRGFYAERRRRLDGRHWSQMRATPFMYPGWDLPEPSRA